MFLVLCSWGSEQPTVPVFHATAAAFQVIYRPTREAMV
jgi:hypothetical protein